jgi:uncharacterized SAM-binding protein YcdF (DUF218 family)
MLEYFLDPITLTGIALLMLVIYSFKYKLNIKIPLTLFFIFFMTFNTPFGANLLLDILENSYVKACNDLTDDDVIVILAGGMRGEPESIVELERLHSQSYNRIYSGARLAEKYSKLPIIVSGGGTYKIKEADLMGELLFRYGINKDRIIKETKSNNTYASAINTSIILKKMNAKRVCLVTSAIHMPRAMGVYKRYFPNVLAYPVNRTSVGSDYVFSHLEEAFIPQISSAFKSFELIHEFVGIFIYWFKD